MTFWPYPASEKRLLSRESERANPTLWSATSKRGIVASAHFHATAAGAKILAQGGNAIDAAIATSLTLAVCESAGSGLGGMAMMLVHHAASKRTFVIEGACRAPRRATPEIVAQSHRYRGYRSVAVPMNISVLSHALRHYGTVTAEQVLAPAIELAEGGFLLSTLQHQNMTQYRESLRNRSSASWFLRADGDVWPAGTRFTQPALGATLRRLARVGLDEFYVGEIGQAIVSDMRENNGFIDDDDLREARVPREIEPDKLEFRDHSVVTTGPPAGGLTLLQMLGISDHFGESFLDLDTPAGLGLVASVIKRAREQRRKYRLKAGDSLRAGLLDVNSNQSTARELFDKDDSLGETSHLSVMDKQGNAVGLTQSIERSFGSGEATPSLGFLYNGYLRAFKVENDRHPHYLRPGAVARSNAAPTILLRDDRPEVVIGSTGSERMTSGIFEVLLRLRGADPFSAVHAPRIHATPEGIVLAEASRLGPSQLEGLRRFGFSIQDVGPYSFKMGGLHLAVRRGDEFTGVADPRRDGAAAG